VKRTHYWASPIVLGAASYPTCAYCKAALHEGSVTVDNIVTCREHAKLASNRAAVVAKLKTWAPQWRNPALKEPS
jgi:hypothetical protein